LLWKSKQVPRLALAFCLGLLLALGAIFVSRTLQDSLAWRSDRSFERTSREQLKLERSLLTIWTRSLGLIPKGSVLLLGDSHFHALPALALGADVVNMAIGGLSAERLEAYFKDEKFPSPLAPRKVALFIGHNDLAQPESLERTRDALTAVT
jgi:hypothetical protein